MPDTITFLGTADGVPSPARFHASLLLRLAGRTVLLDCGEPCSHTLKRLGADLTGLEAVIVTHTHSDHVAGLPMLLQAMWLARRTRPLAVHLPRHAIEPLRTWLRCCYLFEEQFKFRVHWRALTDKTAVRIGPVRIRARRTTHLDATRRRFARKYPRVGFDSFSLLIEGGGKRAVYSADLGRPRDLAPLLDKPVDLLIVELSHFHPRDLFDFLRERPIRRVALTHLGHQARAQLGLVRRLAARALKPSRVSFPRERAALEF
jgi:ribonuclease BN (tRNA processing enzyme)